MCCWGEGATWLFPHLPSRTCRFCMWLHHTQVASQSLGGRSRLAAGGLAGGLGPNPCLSPVPSPGRERAPEASAMSRVTLQVTEPGRGAQCCGYGVASQPPQDDHTSRSPTNCWGSHPCTLACMGCRGLQKPAASGWTRSHAQTLSSQKMWDEAASPPMVFAAEFFLQMTSEVDTLHIRQPSSCCICKFGHVLLSINKTSLPSKNQHVLHRQRRAVGAGMALLRSWWREPPMGPQGGPAGTPTPEPVSRRPRQSRDMLNLVLFLKIE